MKVRLIGLLDSLGAVFYRCSFHSDKPEFLII